MQLLHDFENMLHDSLIHFHAKKVLRFKHPKVHRCNLQKKIAIKSSSRKFELWLAGTTKAEREKCRDQPYGLFLFSLSKKFELPHTPASPTFCSNRKFRYSFGHYR